MTETGQPGPETIDRLLEQEANLRTAQRLLGIGFWKLELGSGQLHWSDQVFGIYGLPVGDKAPDFDAYVAMVHPDDRAGMLANFERFSVSRAPTFEFRHRIVRPDGDVIYVRGVAERGSGTRADWLIGVVQDVTEIQQSEAALERARGQLYETLQSISDAYLTMDRELRVTFLNRRAEEMTGLKAEQVQGRHLWEVLPRNWESPFLKQYRAVLEHQEVRRFTGYSEALGRWLELTVYPSGDGLAVHFRDVSAERARLTQLQLLETAVSWQSDSLLVTEARPIDAPDGPKIIYVNDAFTRHTGYTAAEVIGKTPRLLQGRGTDRRELDRIRRALVAGRPIRTELLNYTRAGEEIWLEIDIVPIKDEKGELTHFVSVQRNVTERKRSEEALRISNERLRLVSEAANDAIWDWDLVAGTIWWSRGTLEVLGFDPETGGPGLDTWSDRVHPEDRDRVTKGLNAALAGSDITWSDEYRMCRDDGGVITVADRGSVIRDESGRAVRMLGSIIDITERLRLEQSLRQSQKLEAVGQLTGGVAHDFNNLLTVILGNAELLAERLEHEKPLRDMAGTVVTAATRGAELTRRLLAFARRQPLEPQVVDLNRLVAGMEDLLRRALSENIEIEFVRAGGLWLAEIDPSQLESALLNLAINARDAMPEGGRLTIETGNAKLDQSYVESQEDLKPGQYVMISVTDSGCGMDADTRSRAFDPFFTTKPAGKGSGLGLSMVYGFAKQSRGHVRIYSEPGEGTAVKLYLPRSLAGKAAEEQATDRLPAGGGGEHILVVEDDRLVRENLVAQLRELGYQVTSAPDALKALELLKRDTPADLLFTDVVMPGGMNGRELAEAALAMRPDLKVLFTSGYTENAIIHQGRLDAGVQLLSKPYRRQELAAKVRKVLDGRC